MSQHNIRTVMNNEAVDVSLGYDRPFTSFFMVVTKPVECTNDVDGSAYTDTEYLYDNLDDPNLEHGLCRELAYFQSVLSDLNITLSSDVFSMVNDDTNNPSNIVAFYEVFGGSLHPIIVHINDKVQVVGSI